MTAIEAHRDFWLVQAQSFAATRAHRCVERQRAVHAPDQSKQGRASGSSTTLAVVRQFCDGPNGAASPPFDDE